MSDDDAANPPQINLEPTEAQLNALDERTIAANSVASEAQVTSILNRLRELYPEANASHLLATVFAAGDQGSSRLTALAGEHDGVPLQAVMNSAQSVVTFRQFCMYYAKYYWNHCVSRGVAPANWLRANHTFETRYSGFDFFSGVLHPAARTPPGGLRRLPTDEEVKAHNLNARVAINRAFQGSNLTTAAEVTGARTIRTTEVPRLTFN